MSFTEDLRYHNNFAVGMSLGGTLAQIYVNKETLPEGFLPEFMHNRRTWGMEEFYDAACRDERKMIQKSPGMKAGIWRGFLFFVVIFRKYKAHNFSELAEKMKDAS